MRIVLAALLSFASPCPVLETANAAEPAPTSGFAEVDGGLLYYEITGSGEPVVLIHGNFGDRRYWDHQVAPLARSYRVLRYDVRGFGKSSLPTDTRYSDYGDLARLLDALGIARAHMVGFSMGAAIATDFVVAYPKRSLSLVSVGPWVNGHSSEAVKAVFDDFAAMATVVREKGTDAAAEYALTQTFLRPTVRRSQTEAALRRIVPDFSWWYFRQKDPRVRLSPSAAERLGELTMPVLIVTAEHDIPACLEFANLLDGKVRDSTKITFADAGHFMMIDRPEAFNRALLDFFGKNAGR